ncbi:MAG TPA: rhomboid family protein [Patescibacteria group bacterium]|nr:rhomboid family protein [Patescibacteria group bacterium]
MIHNLAHQRCFNHAEREAVALCPECRLFFCRECITEHDDRVICARCLQNLTAAAKQKAPGWAKARALTECGLGLLAAWFFFYLIGEILLAMPTSFHEGTFWQAKWWHEQ